jgi:transcriptional regulator with XRE-family HTH domain
MSPGASSEDPVLLSRTHPIPGPAPPAQTWISTISTGLSGIAVTTALLAGHAPDATPLSKWTRPPLTQPTPPAHDARSLQTSPVETTATIVRELHAKSGLTWEQLGRLLGVSRRAVHLWAAGGRANSRHVELLLQLRGIIDNLPADSAHQRRMLILQARYAEPSIFDTFLRQRTNDEGVVAGTPFSPDQLLGARYDEVESE